MTDLTLTFLGTSAAVPTNKRGLSAISLVRGGDSFLFDCGEGTQRQMTRFGAAKSPTAIFLTHGHADHWSGLPGLLSTLEMRDQSAALPIYVPQAVTGKVRAGLEAFGALREWVNLIETTPGSIIDFEDFAVFSFKTDHSKGSVGYIFREDDRPGRFDPQIAIGAGIEPGPDFARLQAGFTVRGLRPEDVIGPTRKGRKIVITGDTRPTETTSNAAVEADLLIHEATFENEKESRAVATKHSTGGGAGLVAANAPGLRRLVLTHFSPRSNPTMIGQEAAKHFSPVECASDGMKITIPLED